METPRRLIPARAGKTHVSLVQTQTGEAHPRAGGENISGLFIDAAAKGSSPRGRGKQLDFSSEPVALGLIPARAGKTPTPDTRAGPEAAHPRAGGENHRTRRSGCPPNGSSPRGRGKLTGGWAETMEVRLIPARAGKTRRSTTPRAPSEAHPRAGGENGRGYGRARR